LRRTGGAGLAASLLTSSSFLTRLSRADTGQSYTGDLVLITQTGTSPDKALPKLLEAYQKAHLGIQVKLVQYPEEKFVALYTAAQAAGEQVDVLMLNGQDLRRYATSNALTSVDDVGFKTRFLPEALSTFTIDDKLWGFPSGALGGFIVFVNKAILEKFNLQLPATYDDLKSIAAVLHKNGIAPFTHPGKIIYMWPVWFFTTFAQTSNNRSIERTIEILSGKGKFTDPDVVQGLDLVFQFGRDKMFSQSVLGLDFGNAKTELLTGKACFYLFHDSITKPMLEAKAPNFELDSMLMPNLVGRPVESQFPGGPGVVLSLPAKVDPSRKQAALDLIDFLTSDDSDRESVELNGGAVPVNVSVPPAPISIYTKEKSDISKLTIYLDWFCPPEITKVLQEGLQAGVVGRTNAEALGKNLQAALDRLVTSYTPTRSSAKKFGPGHIPSLKLLSTRKSRFSSCLRAEMRPPTKKTTTKTLRGFSTSSLVFVPMEVSASP
jgi:raffinose/stachyose/melibiose transport system substrate-binding protein